MVQINCIAQHICEDKQQGCTLHTSDMAVSASVPTVQILSTTDDAIGRHVYDADIYCEENDGGSDHLTVEKHIPPEIDKLSTEDKKLYDEIKNSGILDLENNNETLLKKTYDKLYKHYKKMKIYIHVYI